MAKFTKGSVGPKPFGEKNPPNPGGRPKLPPELKKDFKIAGKEALVLLVEAMKSKDPHVALKARIIVFDKVWGPDPMKEVGALDGDDKKRLATLEAELMRRALEGSDACLTLALRALAPAKYGKNDAEEPSPAPPGLRFVGVGEARSENKPTGEE